MSPTANRRKAASPTQGEAARGEVNGQVKTVEFRDLKLELPAELPATLLFDITELEAAGDNPMPVFRLLRSVLGAEQFVAVRNTVTDGDKLDGLIDELLGGIFEQYGLSLGESSASPDS